MYPHTTILLILLYYCIDDVYPHTTILLYRWLLILLYRRLLILLYYYIDVVLALLLTGSRQKKNRTWTPRTSLLKISARRLQAACFTSCWHALLAVDMLHWLLTAADMCTSCCHALLAADTAHMLSVVMVMQCVCVSCVFQGHIYVTQLTLGS